MMGIMRAIGIEERKHYIYYVTVTSCSLRPTSHTYNSAQPYHKAGWVMWMETAAEENMYIEKERERLLGRLRKGQNEWFIFGTLELRKGNILKKKIL